MFTGKVVQKCTNYVDVTVATQKAARHLPMGCVTFLNHLWVITLLPNIRWCGNLWTLFSKSNDWVNIQTFLAHFESKLTDAERNLALIEHWYLSGTKWCLFVFFHVLKMPWCEKFEFSNQCCKVKSFQISNFWHRIWRERVTRFTWSSSVCSYFL